MCKGLPGCGKTTWAREQLKLGELRRLVRVNKDDIRDELNRKDWNYDVEKEVVRIRDFRISEALSKGLNVVSDDTNLAPKHEVRLRDIARKYKASFEIKDFTTTTIMTCVERDLGRRGDPDSHYVGEKVIRDMAEQFLNPSDLIERTAPDGEAQLFLDLDGVFADFDGFIQKEFGIENNRENDERPDFWDIVRGYPGRLYFDMEPFPRASELFESLRQFAPIILTGCPWSISTAAGDKREWVKKFIDPDVGVVCCKSRNKRLYAKPGDILLDDWNKYRDLWEGAGGRFILHRDVDESIRLVKEAMDG